MDTTTYCSAEITELARAMLRVQADLQPALKDRENTFSHSRYATLNSVMDTCRDTLIKNGIWLAQYPVPVEAGHMGLVTKLTHAESGQWQSSLMVMPLPKADPQGYGSAMTYSRRYALSALIGTEEDDDGELASGRTSKRKRQASMRELADIPAMTNTTDAETTLPPQAQSEANSLNGLNGASNPSESSTEDMAGHPLLADMPKLDGISYSLTSTQDGKTCIVASGNTTSKTQILSQAGFRYSEQRRIWWRYAEVA